MNARDLLVAPLRSLQRAMGSWADSLEDTPASHRAKRAPRGGVARGAQGTHGAEAAYQKTVRELCSGSQSARVRAALALGTEGKKAAADELSLATLGGSRDVRQAALGALLVVDPAFFVDATLHLKEELSSDVVLDDLAAALENGARCIAERLEREGDARIGSSRHGAYRL